MVAHEDVLNFIFLQCSNVEIYALYAEYLNFCCRITKSPNSNTVHNLCIRVSDEHNV